MRIDLFNSQASQLGIQQDPKQVKADSVSTNETAEGGDRTTLTSGSGSIGALVTQAMSSPQIRHDKVASLQQAVSSGQYKLDPAEIAGAMIDEHA
jgi:negative regulator of flagellin synthesis FlgM